MKRSVVKIENVGVQDVVEISLSTDDRPFYISKNGVVSHNCKKCHGLYLNVNGTPKVFKMSELIANGSNYGKKAADWKPCLTSLHPNCRCLLSEVSPGWGFRSGSDEQTFIKIGHNEYLKQKKK
jgi:hypothetical protein